MTIAVIIAFQYENSKFLNGYIIDIFWACQYAQKLGCREIHILTDDKPIYPESIVEQIQNNEVPIDVYQFLINFQKTFIYMKDQSDIIDYCNLKLGDDSSVFFYYTGHGNKKGFECPNDSILEHDHLLECLLKYENIFMVIDCCHAPDFSLPYCYQSEHFIKENHIWYKNKILLISSTNEQSKCVITQRGSPFSSFIFNKLLQESCLLIEEIKEHKHLGISYSNNISASYPLEAIFPSLFSITNIIYHPHYLQLKIKHRSSQAATK